MHNWWLIWRGLHCSKKSFWIASRNTALPAIFPTRGRFRAASAKAWAARGAYRFRRGERFRATSRLTVDGLRPSTAEFVKRNEASVSLRS